MRGGLLGFIFPVERTGWEAIWPIGRAFAMGVGAVFALFGAEAVELVPEGWNLFLRAGASLAALLLGVLLGGLLGALLGFCYGIPLGCLETLLVWTVGGWESFQLKGLLCGSALGGLLGLGLGLLEQRTSRQGAAEPDADGQQATEANHE